MSSSTKGPTGPRYTPLPAEAAVDDVDHDEQALIDWEQDNDTPLSSGRVESARTSGSGSVMFRKAVEAAAKDLEQLAEQAAVIFDLMAEDAFSGRVIRRHRNSLRRMAQKRRASTLVMGRQRRTVWMEESGLTGRSLSRLGRGMEDIEESAPPPISTLLHLAKVGHGERPRRVSIAGADREVAIAYAEANNPTTAFLDLPFGGPVIQGDVARLGRTLSGQHAVAVSFVAAG